MTSRKSKRVFEGKPHSYEQFQRLLEKLSAAMEGYNREAGGEWVAHVRAPSGHPGDIMLARADAVAKAAANRVKNIDLVEEGIAALEAIEQLLCVSACNQMNEVHADKLASLLYVISDRMRQGVDGPNVGERS